MKTDKVLEALRSKEVAKVIEIVDKSTGRELEASKAAVVSEILGAIRETYNLKQEYEEAKKDCAEMEKYGNYANRAKARQKLNEVRAAYNESKETSNYYQWQFQRIYAPEDYSMSKSYWQEYVGEKNNFGIF